jgi:hypothetical protein
MKVTLTIFFVFFISFIVNSQTQIVVSNDLPNKIAINTSLEFNLKIIKGTILQDFNYYLEVPQGISIIGLDLKSGEFSFNNNVANIKWNYLPEEPEFSVILKLISSEKAGKMAFIQRVTYPFEGSTKEDQIEPFYIQFGEVDSAVNNTNVTISEESKITQTTQSEATNTISAVEASNTQTVSSDQITPSAPITDNSVPQANPDSLLRQFTYKIQPIETDNKSINELIQQAFQLRQDAKAANITGLKEKAEAQNLLSMSSEEFKVADTISDVKKKNQALENASKKKLKAENNDLAANKIIELAKSLNESADAIDRIVQNKNNSDLKKELTNKGDQTENGSQKEKEDPNEKSNNSDNIGKESKNKKDNEDEDDEKSSSKLKTFFSKKNRSENEIEYRVQIGSFVSKPNKSNFKGVRKLEITKESDLYKALVGSFDSRDEALIQKNELISKGFDAFIVTYKGGLRVK